MGPDPELTCLGLEYFVFEGDDLWNASDADLLALAGKELEILGPAKATEVIDGTVIPESKAYPVYDDTYGEAVAAVRRFLKEEVPNLQCVGRNGMHRYNNQDHSIAYGDPGFAQHHETGRIQLMGCERGCRLSRGWLPSVERSHPWP